MPKVSIVIVCMNRPDILFPCLDSIRTHTGVSYETLVVAYRFTPANLLAVREKYPWVTVIENEALSGFSENNNLALRQAKGEYCFVVNDDTLMDMAVIDRLSADLDSLPSGVAAVSPKIVFADGKVQTCGRAPWTAGRYMLHYLHLVDETRPSAWSMKTGLFRTATLNGACFLARTEAFRRAGWFDERFFFTPEDIALGRKFCDMGYEVWTDADVVITHLAGGSVSGLEYAIKPARVAGALLYYGGDNRVRRFFLGSYIWLIEGLRVLKYTIVGHSEGRNRLMYKTARNVQRTVTSGRMPGEAFETFYREG
ncbi:MAG: glycosyltransferase family 2 protein [Bacteroidales bacterium]|nr:glycosyltransferase family 2 protein [Bacteroidales bacterium]